MKTRIMIYMAALLAFMASGAAITFSSKTTIVPSTTETGLAYNYNEDGSINGIQTATDLLPLPKTCTVVPLGPITFSGTKPTTPDSDSTLRPVTVTAITSPVVTLDTTTTGPPVTPTTVGAVTAYNYDSEGERNGFYMTATPATTPATLLVMTGTEALEPLPTITSVTFRQKTNSCTGPATVVEATSLNGTAIHDAPKE